MKPSLLVATTNSGKLKEFKDALSSRFIIREPIECLSEVLEVEETGKTYEENALLKARAFYSKSKIPVLADDSGLEVQALGGEPGVFSARYGGVDLDWPERWEFLLSKLNNISPKPWPARFVCVLCYFDGREPHYFHGKCEGEISPAPRGGNGFGYDPLFLYPALGRTFGELEALEKQRVSHRTDALSKFLTFLDRTSAGL